MSTTLRDDRGFTLIELVTVLLIISILVSIAVASLWGATLSAKKAACSSNRHTLTTAIEVYNAETGAYPASVDDLAPYSKNFGSVKKCPSGPDLEYDPVTHVISCPIHGQ